MLDAANSSHSSPIKCLVLLICWLRNWLQYFTIHCDRQDLIKISHLLPSRTQEFGFRPHWILNTPQDYLGKDFTLALPQDLLPFLLVPVSTTHFPSFQMHRLVSKNIWPFSSYFLKNYYWFQLLHCGKRIFPVGFQSFAIS